MKKTLRRVSFLLLSIVGFCLTADFCHRQTKGFCLTKCLPSSALLSSLPSFPTPSSEKIQEIEHILEQPFFFLQKGQQSVAFSSLDNRYILKLLRWDKLEAPFYDTWLFPHKATAIEKKRQDDFSSYAIAYQELYEETGMIYLQIQPKDFLHSSLTVYDPLQKKHTLSASTTPFLLQKKALPFLPLFQQSLQENTPEQWHPFFLQLLTIIQHRLSKNISDSDISIEYNLGILDGKPLLFDIGNIRKTPSSIEKEFSLITRFLHQTSPETEKFIAEHMPRPEESFPNP